MCLAVPGRVISLENRDDTRMAEVDFGGVRKEVCVEYVPDVVVGEYVVVHVGFAIQRLDEASATATLDSFERLGILEEEFGDGFALAARQAGVPQAGVPQAGVPQAGVPQETGQQGSGPQRGGSPQGTAQPGTSS
jgi:hydrogenase expression/formation protein HypC